MNWIAIIGIAFGLAMDAFAVSLAASAALRVVSPRQYFRLSFHFGLFQFLMPVIGWGLGSTLARHVSAFDHWVAFALLAAVGGKMIRESFGGDETARYRSDPTRGWSLVALSLATSIDALAVGISFSMLGVGVLYPSLVIGAVAAAMTLAGMRFGGALGARFGRWMELAGGLVLLVIGLTILHEHGVF